jgi:hypothetical protein
MHSPTDCRVARSGGSLRRSPTYLPAGRLHPDIRVRARRRDRPLGCGNYYEYLIGGMLGIGLAQTAPGVAVALVTRHVHRLIDRFRSPLISRGAMQATRSVAVDTAHPDDRRGCGGLLRPGHRLALAYQYRGRDRRVRVRLLSGYAFT